MDSQTALWLQEAMPVRRTADGKSVMIYAADDSEPTDGMLKADYFPTPADVVVAAVRTILKVNDRLPKLPRILDVGAGAGAWGSELRKQAPNAIIHGIEMRDIPTHPAYDDWIKGDFLELRGTFQYDLIVGNPPFSIAFPIIKHGLRLLSAPGILTMLLKIQFLGSNERASFYDKGHLARVDYCRSRIAFIKKINLKTGKYEPLAEVWDYGLLHFSRAGYRGREAQIGWWDYKDRGSAEPNEEQLELL